jgi:hypothetical protein
MKNLLTLIAMVAVMTGCATDTSTLTKSEQKLQWIKDANPQLDAKKAIEAGDLRLMGLVQRSIFIPGVALDKINHYQQKCGVNLIDGVSDTVLNNNHLKLMNMARQYALQYNSIIKTRCE